MNCAHCGEEAQGHASIGIYRVCHVDSPYLPDCYKRVTVYGEHLGSLKPFRMKPAGVEKIVEPWKTYLDSSGIYGDKTTVCITHRRFIPCRKSFGCVFSTDPEHVEDVRKYQQP